MASLPSEFAGFAKCSDLVDFESFFFLFPRKNAPELILQVRTPSI